MNVIADFIGQIVQIFYSLTGDYGVAIVMITLSIKLLLLPLNIKQKKQLERQKELSQKATEIQKKYANNQKKMNEELQKFYAENGLGSMGCLSTLIQMPIMIGLYHGIRSVITTDTTSMLVPWVPSLLLSDTTRILPIATLVLQIIPMLFPHLKCFEKKQKQKTPIRTIIMILSLNGMFVFMIPSGIGLYYFVSSFFTVVEQLIFLSFLIENKNHL